MIYIGFREGEKERFRELSAVVYGDTCMFVLLTLERCRCRSHVLSRWEHFPALFKLCHFPRMFPRACARSRVCSAGTCGFNVEQKKILARVPSGTRVCVRARARLAILMRLTCIASATIRLHDAYSGWGDNASDKMFVMHLRPSWLCY